MTDMDWTKYPNFSEAEFRCKHTQKCEMNEAFMDRLQRLRSHYAKPMRVTSGYRDATHPAEASKRTTGAHTTGRAVDIAIQGHEVYEVMELAYVFGFTGIGLKQHGPKRFLHLDDLDHTPQQPRPWIWTYS
jgi:uncharacterized protein YcbK (DUF882 family)